MSGKADLEQDTKGFMGTINDVTVWVDGLISVDSTPDWRGGVFGCRANGAVVLVQGQRRLPALTRVSCRAWAV